MGNRLRVRRLSGTRRIAVRWQTGTADRAGLDHGPLHFRRSVRPTAAADRLTITLSQVDCPAAGCWKGGERDPGQGPRSAGLTIAPNPTSGPLSIAIDLARSGASAPAHLELFDAAGRQVDRLGVTLQPGARNLVQYDGSRLNPGVYFLRLAMPGGERTERLIRIR